MDIDYIENFPDIKNIEAIFELDVTHLLLMGDQTNGGDVGAACLKGLGCLDNF